MPTWRWVLPKRCVVLVWAARVVWFLFLGSLEQSALAPHSAVSLEANRSEDLLGILFPSVRQLELARTQSALVEFLAALVEFLEVDRSLLPEHPAEYLAKRSLEAVLRNSPLKLTETAPSTPFPVVNPAVNSEVLPQELQ